MNVVIDCIEHMQADAAGSPLCCWPATRRDRPTSWIEVQRGTETLKTRIEHMHANAVNVCHSHWPGSWVRESSLD